MDPRRLREQNSEPRRVVHKKEPAQHNCRFLGGLPFKIHPSPRRRQAPSIIDPDLQGIALNDAPKIRQIQLEPKDAHNIIPKNVHNPRGLDVVYTIFIVPTLR